MAKDLALKCVDRALLQFLSGMKISYNWLKTYINLPLTPDELGDTLTDLGLEVEGIEEIGGLISGYAGILTGHVIECDRHPDADRLSLTRVDIGSGTLLQIVCGGPNIRKGQKVVVATVGAEVLDKEGKPFTIRKGRIRGQDSEGMICAEDELGLGHDHSGVLVLPDDTPVGIPAATLFQQKRDTVYEIGLTPNRSDATNHLGVARDVLARLQVQFGSSGSLCLPDVGAFRVENRALPIEVRVDNPEACPRYCGVAIQGVTVGESPEWLRNRLASIGIRAINNIVDITNFILHETGQPLHAFDYDAIAGHTVIVKTLPAGTKFVALDGSERTLSATDLMICDGDSKGMCIGGVFGGIHSGVKDTTVNIFLESAFFHPRWIRQTSTRHDLRTEAARCFEKGVDPNQCDYVLKRAALLMRDLAGGTIASDLIDHYPAPVRPAEVSLTYAHINRLIGENLTPARVKEILTALEMEIRADDKNGLTVSVPTNKADVTRETDVIEEILRIHGYNAVPLPTQIRTSIVHSDSPNAHQVHNLIGDYLASNGFAEMMAVSLTQSRYFREILPIPEEALVFVNNTSNVFLDIMRPSMLFSALEAVQHNQNRQNSDLRLFEFGKTYRRDGEDYLESDRLTLTMTGMRHPENWLLKEKGIVSLYTFKTFVENVLKRLGIQTWQETVLEDELWTAGLRYHRGDQVLANFGRVHPIILKKADIRGDVLFADIDWGLLLRIAANQRISFREINKYPVVRRDLALIVENIVKYSDIVQVANKTAKKLLTGINLFDVFEDEQKLGAGKKSYAVSFVFEDHTKTLQDKEIDGVMLQLMAQFEKQLNATIRK